MKKKEEETREGSDVNEKLRLNSLKKLQPSISQEDFRDFEALFFENKKKRKISKPSRKYVYMYSEQYQNVEKLMNSIGKSLKVRTNLPEFKIAEEKINQKAYIGIKKKSVTIPKQPEKRKKCNMKRKR